jgi:putative two-component system response regulator
MTNNPTAVIDDPPTCQPGAAHPPPQAPSEDRCLLAGIEQQVADAKIVIIDDEPLNMRIFRKHLERVGYHRFTTCSDPTEALATVLCVRPDVVLLDIMMPQVSGMTILEGIRAEAAVAHTPVIVLTASSDRETKHQALQLGATDFLAKPVEPEELVLRVRNSLIVKAHRDYLAASAQLLQQTVRRRTAELVQSRLEVVHCLARAAEFRDDHTGRHVRRVGRYAGVIGAQLGMCDDEVETLSLAAQLHDVGKIGIPDDILLKPQRLSADEFDFIQKHCGFGKKILEKSDQGELSQLRRHVEIGSEILSTAQSPLLQLAGRIALTHHERWDGTGYPLGLKGEAIPREGRIVAVADVFDALSTKRPYKPAWPIDQCFEALEQGRGTQFDPRILDAFTRGASEIIAIQIELADVD